MAKRLTDSRKYFDPWIRKLSLKEKFIWDYMLCMCNHAGIFKLDLEMMSFVAHCTITEDDLVVFSDKIVWLSKEKIFIPQFITFQYGTLDEKNRVHKSVLDLLHKEGAYKTLKRPLQGCKDKDKDKIKNKNNNIRVNSQLIASAEKIYSIHYPKKEGKTRGLKKLESDLKDEKELYLFEKAVINYKNKVHLEKKDPKYIKQFSTFASEWRDWIDYKQQSQYFEETF